MEIIRGRNVNHTYPQAMLLLDETGVRRDSRNGPVVEIPGPVTIETWNPRERVLFNATRDANPFFHFLEGLWMLAGRADVRFVAYYVKRMADYSDDGLRFHGGYGYRWRHEFGLDQINYVVARLKKDPNDRRAVVAMWDAALDVDYNGKDAPCNTHAYFKLDAVEGAAYDLRMTVCCRSNDAIWGALGANAVHLSMLHEYVAARLGVGVGTMYQVADSFHAYEGVFNDLADETKLGGPEPYLAQGEYTRPLVAEAEAFDAELKIFFNWWDNGRHFHSPKYVNPALNDAVQMVRAYDLYRARKFSEAAEMVSEIEAPDWAYACREWLGRRER